MADDMRPPAGAGCLGTVVGAVVLAAIVVLVFFVGFIVLAVVAALVVVGLVALGVDRILLALSPRRRERRAAQRRMFTWQFGGPIPGEVIDTTATEPGADGTPPGGHDHGPDELEP